VKKPFEQILESNFIIRKITN